MEPSVGSFTDFWSVCFFFFKCKGAGELAPGIGTCAGLPEDLWLVAKPLRQAAQNHLEPQLLRNPTFGFYTYPNAHLYT